MKTNSGFSGEDGWVDNLKAFDNHFYVELLNNNVVDADFVQEEQINMNTPFPDQFLWRKENGNEFMLDADMAVVVNFGDDMNAMTGEVFCTLGDSGPNVCEASKLLTHAIAFSGNDAAWRQVFHDAFMKMTNIGCSGACTFV